MSTDDRKSYEQPDLNDLGSKDDELSEKDLQAVTGGGHHPPKNCQMGDTPDEGICQVGATLSGGYPLPR